MPTRRPLSHRPANQPPRRWRQTLRRAVYKGLGAILASVAGVLAPAPLLAQWVDFTFTPWGGNYSEGQQISVTIKMCGQDDAFFDAPGAVYFNDAPANFNDSWTSHPDCSDYQVHTGTITLEAGVNTLRAEVAGNGFWEATEYYIAPSYDPAQVSFVAHNAQYRNMGLCAVSCFDATAAYSMPSYVSMDVPGSTGLVYSSATVSGRHTVIADIDDPSEDGADYYSLRLQKVGTSNWVTFTNDSTVMYVTNFGSWQRVALQFDDTTLPTGSHLYTLIVKSHWSGGTTRETQAPFRLLVVNERSSPYGAGWTVAGVQRLYRQADGRVVITEGGGGAAFFDLGCGSWCAPPSDFTMLTEDLASSTERYKRRYPDGTVVSFDTAGLMRKVTERFAGHHPTEFTYAFLAGRWVLQSVSDPVDLVTTFSYTTAGTIDWIEDPGGRRASFVVNAAGNLQTVTDVDLVQALTAVYSDHRLTDFTDRGGQLWTYAYDYTFKIGSVSTPTVLADNVAQRLVTQYRSPERELAVDPATAVGTTSSNLAPWHSQEFRGRVTAPAGEVTQLKLDRFGAPIQEIRPDGENLYFVRNQHSQVTQESVNLVTAAQYTWVGVQLREIYNPRTGEHRYFEYEPTYNLLTREYGSGPEVVYTYNATAEIDSITVGGGPATKYWTSDLHQGRVYRVRDPDGHITEFGWSFSGTSNTETITEGSRITSHAYDAHGRRTRTTRSDGTVDSVFYDPLNRVTRTAGPLATGVRNHYGPLFIDSLTDAKGEVYRWQYNALGWPTAETDPRGEDQTYSYDRRGNVTRWVNREDKTTTFAYDSLGRLVLLC